MSRVRAAAIALSACLSVGLPVLAHDFWIEPSSYRPEPGSVVQVHLRVGQHFAGDLVPRQDELVDRFDLETTSKRTALAGADGVVPAGFASIVGAGLQTLIYQSRGSRLELPADRFEAYLREEGLERISSKRAQRGASAVGGRERFFRCAKSILVAGDPSTVPASPSGLVLEIVPRWDAARLRVGDPLPITLLFRGRPLAGALVKLLAKGDPLREGAARTDALGRASLTLGGGGPYLLKAVWMEAARPGGDVDWESWWASLSFDVVGRP